MRRAFLVVVLVVGIAQGRLSVLTRPGVREARRWKAFYKHLRNAARERTEVTSVLPQERLPYLVAPGAAGDWAKRLKKHSAPFPVPAGFRAAASHAQGRSPAFVSQLTTAGVATSGTRHGGTGGPPAEVSVGQVVVPDVGCSI